jgi:hypothetical protein
MSMLELVAERGPDITYRATNIVAVVGNELTSNKGHIDKMVLIRGVQIINCLLHTQ